MARAIPGLFRKVPLHRAFRMRAYGLHRMQLPMMIAVEAELFAFILHQPGFVVLYLIQSFDLFRQEWLGDHVADHISILLYELAEAGHRTYSPRIEKLIVFAGTPGQLIGEDQCRQAAERDTISAETRGHKNVNSGTGQPTDIRKSISGGVVL